MENRKIEGLTLSRLCYASPRFSNELRSSGQS